MARSRRPPRSSISIHALRVEGDYQTSTNQTLIHYFYPRPPGGGRQYGLSGKVHSLNDFYPRPPGGGRQLYLYFDISGQKNFYPRPPGGGRRGGKYSDALSKKFLSTPSGWRATAKTDKVFVCFCAKGRRICLFKTRKEKNLPVAF